MAMSRDILRLGLFRAGLVVNRSRGILRLGLFRARAGSE